MSWTHDYRDVARTLSAPRGVVAAQRPGHYRPVRFGTVTERGIPQLLRRRARWFGARIRHPRG